MRPLLFLRKYLIVSLSIFFVTNYAYSQQWNDSLRLDVGTTITASAKDFQPFWNKEQKFGTISNNQFDASTYLRVSNKNILIPYRENVRHSHELSIDYGVALYNNNHFKDGLVEQAYAQIKYGALYMIGGRFEDKFDDINNNISSGSLGVSHNSLPIPKISIGLMEYTNLPLTNGWVQVKGLMSHGWMGNDRYFESYLHEKQFYARIGKGKFKLYGGLQHFAEWGGRRPQDNIYLDRSFKGFLNVLFVKDANDGSVDTSLHIRPNRAGDQRGLMEYGFYLDNDNWEMHTYLQTPFESGKGIDIRNIDRLIGICINTKNENALLKSLVVEFLYTKQMEDFGSTEMQSYYNNGAYRTGWEYQGHVIGNSFFTNREDASGYLPVEPFNWHGKDSIAGNENIINNRIIGLHIGANLRLSNCFTSRTLLSSTFNYGSRNYERFYGNGSGKFQFYGLEEVAYRGRYSRISYKAGITFDIGQLYNNIGGSLAINYRLF